MTFNALYAARWLRSCLESKEKTAIGMGKLASSRLGRDEKRMIDFVLHQLKLITESKNREKAAADIDAARIRDLQKQLKKQQLEFSELQAECRDLERQLANGSITRNATTTMRDVLLPILGG